MSATKKSRKRSRESDAPRVIEPEDPIWSELDELSMEERDALAKKLVPPESVRSSRPVSLNKYRLTPHERAMGATMADRRPWRERRKPEKK